jgi:hypothetical protein
MRAVLDFLDGAGWFVLLLAILLLTWMLRRSLLGRRGATLHCGLRLDGARPRRWWQTSGWHTGIARYTPEDLQWFPLLSLGYQPRWTFVRRSIEISGRRYPHGAELLAAPHGAVVVSCNIITRQGDSLDVELAMSDAALTGFLAWIESSAPGAHTHPDTRV